MLVNHRFEEVVQRKSSEIIGRTDSELFPEAVAKLFRESDMKVVATGRAQEFVARVPDPHGRRVSIVTKFPVLTEGHASGSVGGIAIDITDLKQSEALLEAEKRLL